MMRRRGPLLETLGLGIALLLPLIVLVILVREAVGITARFVDRLEPFLPRALAGGPVLDTLVAIGLLLLLALVFGLVGRAGASLRLLTGFENSALAAIPPFSFVRAISASLSGGSRDVKVVLVPADQGQTLAFLFGEAKGERVCVYVPSAPNWTSGQIAFARAEDVQPTDLSFVEATRIIMALGARFDPADPRLSPPGSAS